MFRFLLLFPLFFSPLYSYAQRIKIDITCYTEGASLHIDGEYHSEITYHPKNGFGHKRIELRFSEEAPTHQVVIAKTGYHSDTLSLHRSNISRNMKHSSDLQPNLLSPVQPWPYTLSVIRSSFHLDPSKSFAIFSTYDGYDTYYQTLTGTKITEFDYLRDNIPHVIEQVLMDNGFRESDQSIAKDRPEDFFLTSTDTFQPTMPEVMLGLKITDLNLSESTDIRTGRNFRIDANLRVEWLLFDPQTETVVFQKETQGHIPANERKYIHTLEDAFAMAVQNAFIPLLAEPEFVTKTMELGEQALSLPQ